MARLLHAGRLVALACLALTGCLPAIPTVNGSDTGSLFDVGLADLGVDFDTEADIDASDWIHIALACSLWLSSS